MKSIYSILFNKNCKYYVKSWSTRLEQLVTHTNSFICSSFIRCYIIHLNCIYAPFLLIRLREEIRNKFANVILNLHVRIVCNQLFDFSCSSTKSQFYFDSTEINKQIRSNGLGQWTSLLEFQLPGIRIAFRCVPWKSLPIVQLSRKCVNRWRCNTPERNVNHTLFAGFARRICMRHTLTHTHTHA